MMILRLLVFVRKILDNRSILTFFCGSFSAKPGISQIWRLLSILYCCGITVHELTVCPMFTPLTWVILLFAFLSLMSLPQKSSIESSERRRATVVDYSNGVRSSRDHRWEVFEGQTNQTSRYHGIVVPFQHR